jgi:hypothetical protein
MSVMEREEIRKTRESNSKSKYDNLNNNELKFKQKNPSNLKNRDYSNKDESSSNYEKEVYDYRSQHRRHDSRSRSRSYSRSSRNHNVSKNRHSNYRDSKRHSEHHHHHRRHKHSKRHHRDHSSRKSKNRYRDEEQESMRRHLLKTNSINAFLQGKSSNIFYDDNYLPLSSNSYKYLGKPGLEDNNSLLEKLDEIPISSSDISKKDIELYVINLPGDLAEEQIKELLNTALISIEANDKKGNPIVNVTKGKNGNFFILEFRTTNECKNALKLNGMKILNRKLKIGHPNYLNEKDGNNIINNNGNCGVHDLFPILSSFEKEFDYKKGIDSKMNNSITNYQSKLNNLLSGANLLYTNASLGTYNNSNLIDQKALYGNQSSNEKNYPEPGTKLHIMNLPENFDENDIIKLFKTFGKIRKIELLNDEQTNKFNGQCYLEYEKEKSYQDAINYGTGLKLGDNFLLINRVNPKENNKTDANKINYINNGNYKSNSSLGILASSINIGSLSKK